MMGKLLCLIGFHKFDRWYHVRHPDRAYSDCERCGKRTVYL
jgi:hypothetical protein